VTVHRPGASPEHGHAEHVAVVPDPAHGDARATVPAPVHAEGAHDHGTCLHLDPATRADASKRLKSVRGHVEGVLRMLDDPDVYCVDVLKQVSAVQGALRKVSEGVLRSHVRDHVTTAAQRGDTEHIVDELMEALKYRA
jgi:CsoR family transcriptional regulator, copper-sensing transcriptional repressor